MLGFTALFHLALRSRGGSSSSSSFPSSSFFLLNISLNPDFLIFIMRFDLQPVDLAVVKKQKSIQFLFCSQAANNKAWETFSGWQLFQTSFSPTLAGRSREAAGAPLIARARRALGQMELLGTFPSWAGLLFCFSSYCHWVRVYFGLDMLLLTNLELLPQHRGK